MPQTRRIRLLLLVALAALPGSSRSLAADRLRFAFVRTPWQDVLQWLADSAELSLHVSDLPPGSFTYSDKRVYSPPEAIDRVNLFLIPQRYSLVRSGTLLSVISLDDERSVRQLDAMAQAVDPQELANLPANELVKCLFPLGSIQPEDALRDLDGLLLLREPVLLRQTNQLLITETAGKLRMIQRILASLATVAGSGGPVKKLPLGNLDPERALAQIRPHVGLDPLALSGPEISFSIDADGRQLLASGSREKLDAAAGVVQLLRASATAAEERKPLVFRPHAIGAADLQTVVSVLQTLLAGEDVRLAPDAKSNKIALLATEEAHALVERTIQQLTNMDGVKFRSLPLGSLDARYAMAVLNGMFAPAEGTDAPRIDADPYAGRLFIRAKSSQIAEIRRVLSELGEGATGNGGLERTLPYRGERGRRILEAAVRFWPDAEGLKVLPPDTEQPLEREINAQPPADSSPPAEPENAALIRGQLTPQGIRIQSSNLDALDRFEKHLRAIAGQQSRAEPRMAIYYLKHVMAGEAERLLRGVLEAESAAQPTFGTPLASQVTATIIPDQRLNRMFVYGDESDLGTIQRHLEIIDRENSIAEVKTHGAPRVIRLAHAKAENVAAVLRDAYSGRLGATAEERQQAAQQLQRLQQNPRGDSQPQLILAASTADSSESPRMTLAIDGAGNSLVVTAPSQLADEVEQLALHLDRQAAQVVRVIGLKRTTPTTVRDTLGALLGNRIRAAPSERPATGKPK